MMTFFADNQKNIDRAALVLRVVLAAVMIGHGYQKVFVMGISNMGGMFAQMGAPVPALTGPFIALLEFGGGIAILLGLFTRVFGFLLACDMLGAILIVHGKNGFFLPKGFEFVWDNCGLALALMFLGAGAYSIDALLARRGAPTP
jgi:putative oxidoreductase